MTERMKLLEAVVAAAESLDVSISYGDELLECETRHRKLKAALRAYRTFLALPAQPAGETVTLAVWEHNDGAIQMVRQDTEAEGYTDGVGGWRRLGTHTLEVTP
jgi:hypothetical protein